MKLHIIFLLPCGEKANYSPQNMRRIGCAFAAKILIFGDCGVVGKSVFLQHESKKLLYE